MKPVGVLIPTFRRPDGLECALRSVFAQEAVEELIQDIVVVDNSPEASARKLVARLRSEAPVPLLFVHEPRPGVATARNTGLEAVNAPYVAFLDDDEEAPPDWAARLFHTHRTFKADVTFGPVRGVVPDQAGWAKPYLDEFFSRRGPQVSGLTEKNFGCGNSMMTRATALHGVPFDPAMDHTGGEDDWLFERLRKEGCVFAWSAEAWVWEHAPLHRANLRYAVRRAFSYGQTPARNAAERGPASWPTVLYWMLVGAGQFLVFGLAAAALTVVGSTLRARMADRAARGLGKLIWWRTPTFYGEAEAARTQMLAPAE